MNVAFLTLFERKILGYSQSRKGPNKVAIYGIFQPFADAIKLFIKEYFNPEKRKMQMFKISPILRLLIILFLWEMNFWCFPRIDFSILFILILLRLGLYPLLWASWASNRTYSIIGGLRGVAQTISYEVRMAIILIRFFCLIKNLNLNILENIRRDWTFLWLAPIVLIWLITAFAETNRTPFDFAEGERELVSGFNTEYGRGGFAFIFIAEYGMILFFRAITAYLLNLTPLFGFDLVFLIITISFFWIWVRSTFPRYRYDKLINLAWKVLLPLSLRRLILNFVI